ncbi:MAG: HD domain-containing protein [bacterium]|nr:HD domain-containing protein [bacterium]
MASDAHIQTRFGAPPVQPPPVVSTQRLAALQAFNARLVCMTVDETSYEEVVRGVGRVVGCDSCALFLHDGSSEELELKASVGHDGVEPGLRVRFDDAASIHAQAFREEYLVHVDDLREQPGMAGIDKDMASVLVMPVISNRGPVGVFEFASRTPEAFGPEDIGLCSMAVDQMAYSLENMRLVGELSLTRDAVIRGMAVLAEIRDPCIGGHLSRICAYAGYLAERLFGRMGYHEVTREFIEAISRSAALHDVGKVGIPDAILLKPAKLTDREFKVMKTHTLLGGQLLQGLIQDFGEYTVITMGADVAASHHEWWDGTGYPAELAGREIPLAARIVAICDVYDALTSKRVYKEAWTQADTTNEMMSKAGVQFDPELLKVFLADPAALEAIRLKFAD